MEDSLQTTALHSMTFPKILMILPNFKTFLDLEKYILKFHDFSSFPWLWESCP